MASTQIVGQFAKMTTNDYNAKEHTNRGNRVLESSPPGNQQSSPATGIETNFNDSGFYDCEEETNARRHDYEDWILFPGEIPLVSTDNFFADLDSSTTINRDGESTANIERESAFRARNRRSKFYDPVHEAAQAAIDQSVYDAINDYDTRSQPDYSRPSYEAPTASPFQKWYTTFEKHESLAYHLSQSSNSPRPQHSRQPSQPSDHDFRSR
ncbi:hypothetical protein N431DRAFT_46009 [Stipitochalara longipes BDJ]|nr:hypothetical protein N431DRAFT_46009 [Stipitochalara longipes BDJ]